MLNSLFLYARKSTDTEEKQILSIEAQLTELRIFAQREKLTIKQEFIEAMTAKTPGRPIFNEMITRIERGEADGIVAWHPDRLARNSVDGGRIIYLLDTRQIQQLKFPTFWFENTPQGKFMMNIAFGQSKYFIDNLSENVKRGQRQKLRRGEWPSFPPIGYASDDTSKKLVIDSIKGPLVRDLFESYATGEYTLPDLKKISGRKGLVSRTRKPLSVSQIHRILTSIFYYGLMNFNGEAHQGRHEPLISKELFDQVQRSLVRNGKPNKYHKKYFPLLGLAVCASCGCSITAERQKGHHYYRCTKKRGKCAEPFVREERLAEQVRAAVARVALPTEVYQKMLAAWSQERDEISQPIARKKAELAIQIRDIQTKLDRLLDTHLEGLIDKAQFQSKKEALLKNKIDLEENLKSLEQGATGWLEPCREFLEVAHQAHQRAASENLESQRDFLKKIGSNFRLAAKTLHFDYSLPWRLLAATAPVINWRPHLYTTRTLSAKRFTPFSGSPSANTTP